MLTRAEYSRDHKMKGEREMKKLPDWLIRAIKTFIQAFFGVLIPEIVAMLNNGFPPDWKTVWVILAPTVAAALAAAIAAVWNIILEHLKEDK